MALPTVTGTLDEIQGIVVPNDTGTWADAPTTWDNWGAWAYSPADPLVWLTDVIDLGVSKSFTLNITTVANGAVTYDVYTSDTGVFGGEETVTNIDVGDSGIAAFTGRFVVVAVNVAVTSGINTLEDVQVSASDQTFEIKLSEVDTSTLSGTSSARQLSLATSPSKVVHVQITPEELDTAFDIDTYVTEYATSTQLIPRIVSRTSPVTIALMGRDGIDRDGVCDITLKVMPEQYMSGPNLRTR